MEYSVFTAVRSPHNCLRLGSLEAEPEARILVLLREDSGRVCREVRESG